MPSIGRSARWSPTGRGSSARSLPRRRATPMSARCWRPSFNLSASNPPNLATSSSRSSNSSPVPEQAERGQQLSRPDYQFWVVVNCRLQEGPDKAMLGDMTDGPRILPRRHRGDRKCGIPSRELDESLRVLGRHALRHAAHDSLYDRRVVHPGSTPYPDQWFRI